MVKEIGSEAAKRAPLKPKETRGRVSQLDLYLECHAHKGGMELGAEREGMTCANALERRQPRWPLGDV